jgi:hypothetical protein
MGRRESSTCGSGAQEKSIPELAAESNELCKIKNRAAFKSKNADDFIDRERSRWEIGTQARDSFLSIISPVTI